MKDDLWLESLCSEGLWLHKYMTRQVVTEGVIEVCDRCGQIQAFSTNIPNYTYLAFHLRQALQPEDQRFNKEYR